MAAEDLRDLLQETRDKLGHLVEDELLERIDAALAEPEAGQAEGSVKTAGFSNDIPTPDRKIDAYPVPRCECFESYVCPKHRMPEGNKRADPGGVWPCVQISVDEDGNVIAGHLFAPGLPAGTFNIYPVGIEDIATGRPALAAESRSGDDAKDAALTDLRVIAGAKRFDRSFFEDDTAFADWVQSRARFDTLLLAADALATEREADPEPRAALRAILDDIRTRTDGIQFETLQRAMAALATPATESAPFDHAHPDSWRYEAKSNSTAVPRPDDMNRRGAFDGSPEAVILRLKAKLRVVTDAYEMLLDDGKFPTKSRSVDGKEADAAWWERQYDYIKDARVALATEVSDER